MVRKEYALMRERSKSANFTLPVPHEYRDPRVRQRERAQELAEQGYVRIAEGITHDTFNSLTRSRSWPICAVHLWAIDEVWAPAAADFDTTKIEVARSKVSATPSNWPTAASARQNLPPTIPDKRRQPDGEESDS
ncbi:MULTISPECIES: hypothetical protein [unclassified Sinorhizobium]|uniref:hypothetical protein n=1 Tax=unclassified Sinorhizobium TaxID=2613772 RepID=UPI0024C424E0|nr:MULTISPECIES: hypothetical protein [unclassified Sinorhizobium]MDK1375829.1 hypothetical protein [Sinorhizobium sp. 6-70]MDK1481026.1 hypothetical protein [Sinorhizobium sp. 6-117]